MRLRAVIAFNYIRYKLDVSFYSRSLFLTQSRETCTLSFIQCCKALWLCLLSSNVELLCNLIDYNKVHEFLRSVIQIQCIIIYIIIMKSYNAREFIIKVKNEFRLHFIFPLIAINETVKNNSKYIFIYI